MKPWNEPWNRFNGIGRLRIRRGRPFRLYGPSRARRDTAWGVEVFAFFQQPSQSFFQKAPSENRSTAWGEPQASHLDDLGGGEDLMQVAANASCVASNARSVEQTNAHVEVHTLK